MASGAATGGKKGKIRELGRGGAEAGFPPGAISSSENREPTGGGEQRGTRFQGVTRCCVSPLPRGCGWRGSVVCRALVRAATRVRTPGGAFVVGLFFFLAYFRRNEVNLR